MVINQNLKIDSQYHTVALKPSKDTKLYINLFIA